VRTADIGMLYDPRRPGEVAFATAWIDALRDKDPTLRLRRNYPYLGASDGVCQVMRRRYAPDAYVGRRARGQPALRRGRRPGLAEDPPHPARDSRRGARPAARPAAQGRPRAAGASFVDPR
jgi:hypothetical protein